MPVRSYSNSSIEVLVHSTASEVLAVVEPYVLPKREREANIWHPFARKLKKRETSGSSTESITSDPRLTGIFWLSLWSTSATKERRTLDMVVACTSHHLGDYPIFLYSHHPASHLTPTFLHRRIPLLVDRVKELVSCARVFSVFGPTSLTSAFVCEWTKRTGVIPEPDPFYAAKFTTCTLRTLTPPRKPLPAGDVMRQADITDVEAAAALCKEFADDSFYFPLELSEALKEARELIRNRQLWVYYMTMPDGNQELASIVACTRTSDNVAAITKVYTATRCRSRGCAERLVRKVCEFWLREAGRQSVVLFVAHENKPAEKVYDHVGFEGLRGRTAEGVEDWLEIGFVGTVRGHW
ncbi:hypothetical protein FRB90_005576 [Tulasnella sp. 427]|nr:hypothetical protein FRB90_005576 [Tulasnella sp. 427]